jgi:crotonobetainyl-CoA:carnitine CoA-transferase CaiB-like acyl-CoA transferase
MQARFEHRDQLLEELGAVLRATPAAEWVRRLRPLEIAVGEVVGLADALDGDLVRSRGMVVSVDTPDGALRMVGNPIRCEDSGQDYRPPPHLHEHTGEVLGPATPVSDQAS